MTNSQRSKYFARTVVYARQGEKVLLVDMHDSSTTLPLEPWLGRVYLMADGSHTVQELIDFIARSYPGGPPRTLEATVDSVVDRLQDSKVITLSEKRVTLPYYLSMPADEQDREQANRLMQEDGFQQCALPIGTLKSAGPMPH